MPAAAASSATWVSSPGAGLAAMDEGPAMGGALWVAVTGGAIEALGATATDFAGATGVGVGAGALRDVLNVWGSCLTQSA